MKNLDWGKIEVYKLDVCTKQLGSTMRQRPQESPGDRITRNHGLNGLLKSLQYITRICLVMAGWLHLSRGSRK